MYRRLSSLRNDQSQAALDQGIRRLDSLRYTFPKRPGSDPITRCDHLLRKLRVRLYFVELLGVALAVRAYEEYPLVYVDLT